MHSQKPRSIIESKLEEIEKRRLKEEETYTKLKMIVLGIKQEISRKKRKEDGRNDEENKDKKDMHGIQKVEDQNESTKEVVVNDNKEKKHIVQHINEPKEEVQVENKNDTRIVSSDDNPDANANSKEKDDLKNCNHETPNTDEYEDNVEEQTQNML